LCCSFCMKEAQVLNLLARFSLGSGIFQVDLIARLLIVLRLLFRLDKWLALLPDHIDTPLH